ncbi:hypothetical protein SAMN02990966_00350 [Rhodospirillales bacterium URHD0017]|nr:hypothetical protein SAMN02990966_00350 [Rhodospirillales bacterium URHD0017]
MQYPITLVDVAGIIMAAVCVRSTVPDLQAAPRKMWRLGLPPLLGIGVSLLILAGAVVSFEHDATWMATALAGAVIGSLRGRQITVQTDQVWGTVRMPVVYDTVIAAFCIFTIASADALSGLFNPGTLPRHAHLAAASAFFAGYLAGRAWSLMRRAVRSPHTEIGH